MDGRKVVNSLINTTNVMDFLEFHDLCVETLNLLTDLIVPLCGRYAAKNMIVYENINDNIGNVVFSNDGIHVLNSVEFMSPIQVYIVNYIKYIAKRVERAAADGTSSSIFFSCQYMLAMLDTMKKSYLKNKGNVREHLTNMAKLKKTIAYDFDRLDEIVRGITVNMSEVDQSLREKLIYDLAYTTSKGSKALSEYAVRFFMDAPECLYEYSSFERCPIETDEEFIVEEKEFDFRLNVIAGQNTVFDKKMFTEFDKQCDVLILYDWLSSERIEDLIKFINTYERDHLLIVVKTLDDRDQRKLEVLAGSSFTLCKHTSHTPTLINNPVELMTVYASSGKQEPTSKTPFEEMVIEDVQCLLTNKSLTLSNMINMGDETVHPLFTSEASVFYNKMENDILELLQSTQTTHIKDEASSIETKEFVRIYKNLVCPRLPILKVGGLSTKHMANLNVVEDTIGAVSVAMKHGVLIDAWLKIAACTKDIILPGLSTFNDVIYGNSVKYASDPIEDSSLTRVDSSFSVKETSVDDDEVAIVQSAKAITEFARRMKEVMVEIASINQVIIPNGVVTNKETEQCQ